VVVRRRAQLGAHRTRRPTPYAYALAKASMLVLASYRHGHRSPRIAPVAVGNCWDLTWLAYDSTGVQ
jgi:hypothetical protein